MRGDEGIAPYEGVCQQNNKLQLWLSAFVSKGAGAPHLPPGGRCPEGAEEERRNLSVRKKPEKEAKTVVYRPHSSSLAPAGAVQASNRPKGGS